MYKTFSVLLGSGKFELKSAKGQGKVREFCNLSQVSTLDPH